MDIIEAMERQIDDLKLENAHITAEKRRTPQEIIDQTNELAREFYRLTGHSVNERFRFERERNNEHPQERMCWRMACFAQELLTNTDVDDVLSEIGE